MSLFYILVSRKRVGLPRDKTDVRADKDQFNSLMQRKAPLHLRTPTELSKSKASAIKRYVVDEFISNYE
jgi:hypothetical protein